VCALQVLQSVKTALSRFERIFVEEKLQTLPHKLLGLFSYQKQT
jgi:hypothetical protein